MNKGKLKKYKTLLAGKRVRSNYDQLRAVSGPTRYRILVLLDAIPSGMTVSDIARVLGASLSRVSHQMRILRKYGVVNSVRHSRTVTYSTAHRRIAKYLTA